MTALLTVADYRLLRHLLEQMGGTGSPIEPLLRHKLENARMLAPGETASRRARSGSRVRFQIGDRRPDDRVLVLPRDYVPDGRYLSLDSPAGIMLLGLARGDEAPLPDPEHDGGHIRVLEVCSLDEATPPATAGAVIIPFPRRAPAPLPDGHGPSAA